jgi:hypothetical protein
MYACIYRCMYRCTCVCMYVCTYILAYIKNTHTCMCSFSQSYFAASIHAFLVTYLNIIYFVLVARALFAFESSEYRVSYTAAHIISNSNSSPDKITYHVSNFSPDNPSSRKHHRNGQSNIDSRLFRNGL